MSAYLSISHLDVEIGKTPILKDVSLSIEEGEFVSILGPSGCGKTTLLKTITGFLSPKAGSISLSGQDITMMPPEKRGTIIVFQDLRLFPHLSVAQNISFSRDLRKADCGETNRKVEELLSAVQLSGYGDRRIRELSGGQKQRVALARALAADPRVLLLDEAFSGLDEQLRREMGMLVKELQRTFRITTLLVTHDKREALMMSDRIGLFHEGRLLQYGSPEEMFEKPVNKLAADYFGTANYFRTEKGLMMIRPFSLRPDMEGSAWEVQEIAFMGEYVNCILRLAGEAGPKADREQDGLMRMPEGGRLTMQLPADELREKKIVCGSRLSVRIREEDAVIFPEEHV
ncbi:MAG: ABC transporter ATP-binding protein [Eubacteriales bacterium]|nr:ABC transporter ATP-binding protein [Eubacteriales bacterium]